MSGFFIDESEDGIGRVFVPRGPWRPDYKEVVENQHIEGVRLSASMGWRGADVGFLRELPDLRSVEIYSPEVRDARVLGALHRLQLIGLDCDLGLSIDLGGLEELEVVKARWTQAIRDVLHKPSLKHLNLSKWPYEDLEPLATLRGIVRLQLTSRKLASVRGIGALKALEWLDLDSCPRLSSVVGLRDCQRVSHIELTSCRAIDELSEIGELSSLTELHLDNNGAINSLKPLVRCRRLEKLSFLGSTRVLDGEISVLESLPSIKVLRFAPRRHYDRTRAQVLSGDC